MGDELKEAAGGLEDQVEPSRDEMDYSTDLWVSQVPVEVLRGGVYGGGIEGVGLHT